MKFDGYDFIILGAVLAVVGGFMFAKPASFPTESAQMFLGGNPFQIRNSIITRHETIGGTFWITLGLIATIVGTVRAVRYNQSGSLLEHWLDILVLLAAGLVIWRLTVFVTDWSSRAEYVPVISNLQRQLYAPSVFMLTHSGLDRKESAQGILLAPDIVEKRLSAVTTNLDQIGKLLDEPRGAGEGDECFAKRLSKYFLEVAWD